MTDDLDAGVERLDALACRLADGAVAFAPGDPDARAASLLASCQAPDSPAWTGARDRFDAFLVALDDHASALAVLRGPAAAARVGWGGSTTTTLREGADPEALRAHADALRARVQRRLRDLRLLAATVTAAARVAARLALPGGPILALPVVYDYLRTLSDPSA